jgi:predicted DNA-binding mobile mystery protein A
MKSETARKALDKRLKSVSSLNQNERPHKGWIRAVREAVGMTSTQLAKRMGVVRSRITHLEKSEIQETLTLETLRRAANALDCSLVYVFVPRKSFQDTVEARARRVAAKLIRKVDHTMALEDQNLEEGALAEEVETLAQKILRDKQRLLWDDRS